MAVTSVYIYYPSKIDPETGALTAQTVTAYDLRRVSAWTDGPTIGATATVWASLGTRSPTRLLWPKAEAEAALDASLGIAVPENLTAPVITGTAYSGYTLTSTDGTWTNSPTSFTYQWTRNGVNIVGATANTYLATVADEGAAVRLAVVAVNAGGPSAAPALSNALEQWVPADAAAAPQGIARARDTSSLTLDGTAVDAWVLGGSVGGTLATAVVGEKPAYSATSFGGRPGLTFDGTGDSIGEITNLPYLRLASGGTIAMAARTDDPVGTRRAVNVCTNNTAVTRMGIRQSAGVMQIIGVRLDAGTFTSHNFGTPTASQAVYVGVVNHAANTALGSINGVASTPGAFDGAGSTSDTDSSRRRIGSAVNGAADFWLGVIAEFVIYNVALSTDDRQKLEGYLAWANHCVGQLNAGHPYKTVPPSP